MEMITDNLEYDRNTRNKTNSWMPFLRQLFIISGVWTTSILLGLSMGAPTVLIPQLRREANSSSAISIHMETWISSVMSFSGIPWIVILTFLVYFFGRKRTCIFIAVSTTVSFIIFYCSTDPVHVLISQIIQGPLMASQITTSLLIPSEYLSPQYRGVFLAVKVANLYWGIWIANAIGTFSHWRNIGVVGIICSIYAMINAFLWRESPYWLLIKGRISESIAAHHWLKGRSEESERELKNLVKLKEEYGRKMSIDEHAKNFCNVLLLPDVYKALGLCVNFSCIYTLSGKVVCTMYSFMILKNITANESLAYIGMLILDGVTVFSMYCGCILMKFMKRRTLLFSSSTLGVMFLYLMALYLYLIKKKVITGNSYVSVGFLLAFFVTISAGPITMSGTLLAELIPLKSRSISVCVSSFFALSIMSIMLKVTPYLFLVLDICGTFLFFAASSSVFLYIAYKYLPETKDRTLLEISDILRGCPKTQNGDKEMKPLHTEKVYEE